MPILTFVPYRISLLLKMLLEALKSIIHEYGYISVDRFMSLVVPYYYANQKPFGKDGDFVTAPEISQMFGESIAIWIAHNADILGYQSYNVLELGPGNATLAKDILNACGRFKSVEARIDKYFLYESSLQLRGVQQDKLRDCNAFWIQSFDDVDTAKPLFVVANEFLDALPITQITKKDGKMHEVGMICDPEFSMVIGNEMTEISDAYDSLPEGAILEIPHAAVRMLADIVACLGMARNVHFLFIDYGYFDSPLTSTLQALYTHKKVDLLSNIGEADVTSLVNFPAIASALENLGFAVDLTTQAAFLQGMGIEKRAERLASNNPEKQVQISEDLDRLTGKNHMGELFKVLIAQKVV